MTHNKPDQTSYRRKPSVIVIIMIVVLALVATVSVVMMTAILGARDIEPFSRSLESPATRIDNSHRKQTGGLGVAGGDVPQGTTVSSDIPAITNLEPALRTALDNASKAAAKSGITIYVNSGWRSPDFQEHLLEQAVNKYGSQQEASRWVATAETSSHVSGDAVDIGRWDASEWMSKHGAKYGLCQIYDNEAWHFELRSEATKKGCPTKFFDPTFDPRMTR